jgi:hypothetical protein
MKTLPTNYLFLIAFLIIISCSTDGEIHEALNDAQDRNLPDEPFFDEKIIELKGLPKRIQKYENGNLHYRAQYFYRPDGALQRVEYSYPKSGSEIFTNTYYYDTEGKLIKLDGHDVYKFHWDKERIVEVDGYNGMWSGRSKISFTYNAKGQIIQRLDYNLDFFDRGKTIYSYFNDGNLKTIEQYGGTNENGAWILHFITNFDGYNQDKNLFLELEIIPGRNAQHQFPTSMSFKHITATGYDIEETYTYKYDSEGRVIQKISGSNKIIYQYY